MSLPYLMYRSLAPVLGAIAPAAEVFTAPHQKALWRERLGAVSLPGGCHAWIHAASLGETLSVPPLLRELRRLQPEARFWLTASTQGGRDRLAAIEANVSLAPIDSPQGVRRFFQGVQPHRLFLIETELWPHWLLRARAEHVPVAVLSARLSARSVQRYLGLGSELRGLVRGLDAVLCQTELDAERWRAIGADPARVAVIGNLKSDGLPDAPNERSDERRALGLDPDRPVLVLGSLRPGEAGAVARAWRALPDALRRRWQVVAVPRHPRAAAELHAEALSQGIGLTMTVPDASTWRWDDRMGVLVDWYRAADVAFVGGSLSPYGGHNPLEPAACGCAVLMGPHHATQRDYVRVLREAGAIRIAERGAPLVEALATLLGDGIARSQASAAGLEVAHAQRGSATRAVQHLEHAGLWPA